MNIIDRMFRFGSTFRLLLFLASVIVLSIYILRNPGQNRGTWIILIVGFIGTAREYHRWQANRRSIN
jgi:hypothetical protein